MAADVFIGSDGGNATRLRRWPEVAADMVLSIQLTPGASVDVARASGVPDTAPAMVEVTTVQMSVDTANAFTLAGVSFSLGGKVHQVKSGGAIQTDLSTTTGNGTTVGQMSASQLVLDVWPTGASPAVSNFRGLAAAPVTGPFSPFGGFQLMFRTATAPLRPGSLTVQGSLRDGTTVNVAADTDGVINTARVKGRVDYSTGVVDVIAVSPVAVIPGQSTVDIGHLRIPGVGQVYLDQFKVDTLRYNAVAYTYLPLNSELLGIDPVRLPSDGRVPIFAPGYLCVFGRTEQLAPQTYANGATGNVGQVRLSHMRLVDANNRVIDNGYSVDLDAGTFAVQSTAGWAQPVRMEWRIEDMVQARDTQINGLVSFLPALSHEYPADGKSYVSSALAFGDLVARVGTLFTLATFDPTFSTTPGAPAPNARFDDTNAPLVVTNAGTVTENWAIVFTSPTAFVVRGQHLGQIGVGQISEDCAPINPNTSVPYFLIPKAGWGAGWATGNTLRFPTVACGHSMWAIRTVRQGPPAGEDYSFELLPRGGIDNPL